MSEPRPIARSGHTHFLSWPRRSTASDTNPDASKVDLHGRITVENSNEMRRALGNALRQKVQILRVDLSDVSYIDTSGVATLVEAASTARKQGTRMILDCLHDQPQQLLEITRLDHLFEIASQEAGK